MPRIVTTPKAEEDLTGIWLDIARKDVDAATKLLRELDEYLHQRASFPKGAQPCKKPFEYIRVISFKRVNVYVRSIDDGFEVVRVLWNSKKLKDLGTEG